MSDSLPLAEAAAEPPAGEPPAEPPVAVLAAMHRPLRFLGSWWPWRCWAYAGSGFLIGYPVLVLLGLLVPFGSGSPGYRWEGPPGPRTTDGRILGRRERATTRVGRGGAATVRDQRASSTGSAR